jgi:hypothetical protein
LPRQSKPATPTPRPRSPSTSDFSCQATWLHSA